MIKKEGTKVFFEYDRSFKDYLDYIINKIDFNTIQKETNIS